MILLKKRLFDMSLESSTLRKGEVAFVWFNNYSGVTLRTPNKTFVFDPADIDPKVFKMVDVVLVTHEHADHFDPLIIRDIQQRTQCLVVADTTSAKRLGDSVSASKLQEMQPGKEIRLDDVTILAEAFRHPAATPVSYLITTEDGVRVYHTGDSLPYPDMKQIGERSPPDIVFCTVGVPAPGASPETGLEIVRMVKPKVAIPYHALEADRKRFDELVAKETPNVKSMLLDKGEPAKYP